MKKENQKKIDFKNKKVGGKKEYNAASGLPPAMSFKVLPDFQLSSWDEEEREKKKVRLEVAEKKLA